jgi:ATP synthase protein I
MLRGKTHVDKATKKMYLQVAYGSSAGIAMVLAIFGCLQLGNYLDGVFDTGYKLTIFFLLFGIIVAFYNLFYMIRKYFPDENPVMTHLKSEPHRKRPPFNQD